jgi:hypothetical protein
MFNKRFFITIVVLSYFLQGNFVYAKFDPKCQDKLTKCQERLSNLEPDVPKDLPNPPFNEGPKFQNVKTSGVMLKDGKNLKYQILLYDPKWERPSYRAYWHSTFWRWSYVPTRVHFAKHRLFVSPTNAAALYDFYPNVGIVDEMKNVKLPNNNILNYMLVVVMNTDISSIKFLDRQVSIIGKPQKSGLSVLALDRTIVQKGSESVYVQLITPEGYEVDNSLFR